MGLCTSKNNDGKNESGNKPEPKKTDQKKEQTEQAEQTEKADQKSEKAAEKTEEPKAAEAKAEVNDEPKVTEEKQPEAAKVEEPKAEVAEEPKAEVAVVAAAEEVKTEEAKAEEAKTEEAKAEEAKTEEAKAEEAPTAAAVVAPVDGEFPPYTNRPEDLESYPKASGAFVQRTYEVGVVPDCSNLPALTGEFVTDGKVSFDKAALSIEGVFATRDEEVAQQQKAIDLKKDAAAATSKANELHEEANKLYEAGDKDGNKAKMAESKEFRAKAQEIHQESFDLAYACAMSQAFKALYSKYPSVDYHVFLLDPYEKSYLVVIEMMKKYRKFNRKDFLCIPGEGQHSTGKPVIPPHFQNWLKEANIQNEQITSGSFAIILDSVPAL